MEIISKQEGKTCQQQQEIYIKSSIEYETSKCRKQVYFSKKSHVRGYNVCKSNHIMPPAGIKIETDESVRFVNPETNFWTLVSLQLPFPSMSYMYLFALVNLVQINTQHANCQDMNSAIFYLISQQKFKIRNIGLPRITKFQLRP